MNLKQIKTELLGDILHKHLDANFIYTEDDRLEVCIHRVIDSYVSYISVADVERLANQLGATNLLKVEQEYLDEFGELPKGTTTDNIAKLRLLLYCYFEGALRQKAEEQINSSNVQEQAEVKA